MEDINEVKEMTSEQISDALLLSVIDSSIETGTLTISTIRENFNLEPTTIFKIIDKIYKLGIISEKQGSRPGKYLITEKEWQKQRSTFEEELNIDKNIIETCLKKYKKNEGTFRKLEDYEDPLLPDVIDYILEINKVSSGHITKKFKTGYSRTERILLQLQQRKIISRGTPPLEERKILISKKEWANEKKNMI